ncbi:helix-turn-helix domain-containing protein [Mycolicibacterium sp. S3B2]|uniref:helix-turn-helix domain-containing protein n=1 Tax=Mycolicibacterium sp. S3B2 TaxID=3415120 RepID=UPI003C7B2954
MTTKTTHPQHRRRSRPKLDTYLTIGEAADMLGVTQRYFREQVNTGRVPAYRIGPRTTRVKLSDVEAMLEPVEAALAI